MSRSTRIHHSVRIKNNRRNYLNDGRLISAKALGILLHTPALCSCWMCGNPRKYLNEITKQEVIHRIIEREYYAENLRPTFSRSGARVSIPDWQTDQY